MNQEHHPSNNQYHIPEMPKMSPQQVQQEQGKDKKKSRKGVAAVIGGGVAGLVIAGTAVVGGIKLGQDNDKEPVAAPDVETSAPAVPGETNPDGESSNEIISIDMEGDILSQVKALEIRDNGDELLSDAEFLEAHLDRMNKWQMAGATQEDYDKALSALQAEGYTDPSVAEVAYKIAETHAPVFAIALFGSSYMSHSDEALNAVQGLIGVNAAALDQFFTTKQDSRSGVPYYSYYELDEVIYTDRHKYDAGTMTFSVVQRDNAKQSGAPYSVDGYTGEATVTTGWYTRGGTTHVLIHDEEVVYTDSEEYGVEEIESYSFVNTDMGDDSSYVN